MSIRYSVYGSVQALNPSLNTEYIQLNTDMKETLEELRDYIRTKLVVELTDAVIEKGELTVLVQRESIYRALSFLRDDVNCQFRILIDICGVDYPSRPQRFEVVYHLLSIQHNQRIRVKLQADEANPVPSVTALYPAAGWFEREAWDMYGIFFSNNADLRRILTDYGFDGHPQRKDFPLTGYVEMRYDEVQKRVVYEPVQLMQAFRKFDFLSPWEGGVEYQVPEMKKPGEAA